MKTTFPWTTVIFGVTLLVSITVLAVVHAVNNEAFPALVALLPTILVGVGAGYAENTNRAVKNGLVTSKVEQGLSNMGITKEAMSQSQQLTQTAVEALVTHTKALNTLLAARPDTSSGGTDGPVHG